MPCTMRALSRVLLLVSALGLLSGCVTSKKYKMVKEGAPPEQAIDLSQVQPGAEVKLSTVIIFKGPGSWKREAHWDEYVVAITNHGTEPLRIDNATLIDVLGKPQVPGTDPWKLEKLSSSNWDKYGSTGLNLLAGAGGLALYGAVGYAAAAGELMSTGFGGAGAASAGAAGVALTVIPIAAAIDITAVAVMNHNNKKKIVAEFDRRRFVLPLTIAPGGTAKGSFFFPMTPGPQRLVLNGKAGETAVELVLELKQLAGLHLKPKDGKAKAP